MPCQLFLPTSKRIFKTCISIVILIIVIASVSSIEVITINKTHRPAKIKVNLIR